LAIAVSIRTCLAGHRVQFATATACVARLAEAMSPRARATSPAVEPGFEATKSITPLGVAFLGATGC